MRFHSTPQSALDLEITWLAIIETVLAVALYVGIGLYFGTFKYLAMAVVVAPLMLFRTEKSAEWGIIVFERYYKQLTRMTANMMSSRLIGVILFATLILLVLIFVILPVVGSVIRIVATLYWLARIPLKTLSEMPQNWLRQCLCMDFFHVPEILPQTASRVGTTKLLKFQFYLWPFHKDMPLSQKIFALILVLPGLLIGYLPSLLYRISFKATAVAYLPGIWVAHLTLRNPLPIKSRLERLTKGELEKLCRYVSSVIGVAVVAKFSLYLGWVDRAKIEEKVPILTKKFIETVVVPSALPWWQITLIIVVGLTFVLFLLADAALTWIDQKAWKEESALTTVSAISFVRAILSIATIWHFFWIAFVHVVPASVLRLLGA